MDEIKFRGRRTDNKEWVYGWYLPIMHNEDDSHFHTFIVQQGSNLETPPEDMMVEVEPETVGQFIGRYDLNNKEIYEGDKYKYPNTNYGYGDPNVLDYHIRAINNIEDLFDDGCIDLWEIQNCEVIGNIYDN